MAAYRRTNLTLRRLARLFGVSKSAADRIVDHLGPALVPQPRGRFRKDTVLVVDGTPVPTRDRAVAASGENCRHPTNHRVVIDADALPGFRPGVPTVIAVGKPVLPGNRNDCRAWEESGAKAAAGTTPR
ncbi:IS5 family transposase ISStsp6 [Streptomyces sp. enrichment culture]